MSYFNTEWNTVLHFIYHKGKESDPRVVSVIFTYSYSDYLDQRTFWTSLNVTQCNIVTHVSFHSWHALHVTLCYIQRGSESSLVKKIRIWIWISVANNPGVESDRLVQIFITSRFSKRGTTMLAVNIAAKWLILNSTLVGHDMVLCCVIMPHNITQSYP